MTKPPPLRSRSFEAGSNINPEVEGALSAAAGIALTLLGYTIENPKGVHTKLVKYDGRTEWLKWINDSFRNDDADKARMINTLPLRS